MARPTKWRKVCSLPLSDAFGPMDLTYSHASPICMSVEEYETIRLIDYEGLNQEECAEQMKVARATVQRIYNESRKKLAAALVEGQMLKIEGGNYQLCKDELVPRGCSKCRRRQGTCDGPKDIQK